MDMFGSIEVRAVDTLSFAAIKGWTVALLEWRDFTELSALPEMRQKADEKWEELQSLAETASLADMRLAEAITAEAAFKKPFKRTLTITRNGWRLAAGDHTTLITRGRRCIRSRS